MTVEHKVEDLLVDTKTEDNFLEIPSKLNVLYNKEDQLKHTLQLFKFDTEDFLRQLS